MAAALHSSMAPVLASLDVFDANYTAGSSFDAPVVLINEKHHDVPAKLDLYVTPVNPDFIMDAKATGQAVWHASQEVTFKADSMRTIAVEVQVPQDEGAYFLAAVVTREGDTPVVSQRALRAIDPGKHGAELKGRRVFVRGEGQAMREVLKRHGCVVTEDLRAGEIDADVVVIGNVATMDAEEKSKMTEPLWKFAEAGGRVVVLDQFSWPWPSLTDVHIGLPPFTWRDPVSCSRAHRVGDADHAVLRDIPPQWLWRWNGLPGEIVREVILDESPALARARRVLWGGQPEHAALASVPRGKGELLFCQLKVSSRLDRKSEIYDPMAEQMLVNLVRP
jgi:hypothetical protein